jgi:hypothetical protein
VVPEASVAGGGGANRPGRPQLDFLVTEMMKQGNVYSPQTRAGEF